MGADSDGNPITVIINSANIMADLGVGMGVAGAGSAGSDVQIQQPTSLDQVAESTSFNNFVRLPFVTQR